MEEKILKPYLVAKRFARMARAPLPMGYRLVGKMNRDGLQEAAKIIHRDLVTRN